MDILDEEMKLKIDLSIPQFSLWTIAVSAVSSLDYWNIWNYIYFVTRRNGIVKVK